MKIGVFIDQPTTPLQDHMVKTLRDNDYAFTVDGLHRRNLTWLTENFPVVDHQLFFHKIEEEWKVCQLEKLEQPPDMVVYFNNDEMITDADLQEISDYFVHLLEGRSLFVRRRTNEFLLTCRKSMIEIFPFETNLPLEDKAMEEEKGNHCYEFQHKVYPEEDLCLASIAKPFTDRPYTVVIRKFKESGFKPLFTSLFVIDSWGCYSDVQFLNELWNELKMDGMFDIHELLKAHTELCFPAEGRMVLAEPEVYRRDIDGTKKEIDRKFNGKCFFIE
jgi:hypothetical protein